MAAPKHKVGSAVFELRHKVPGYVCDIFDSWEDLKLRCDFVTMCHDDEEYDIIDRLVNGDPKDQWLETQEIPFTAPELNEYWYAVILESGGCIWSCESRLKTNLTRLN